MLFDLINLSHLNTFFTTTPDHNKSSIQHIIESFFVMMCMTANNNKSHIPNIFY